KEAELALGGYPIDLIIEYLKHAHFLLIKHKLPYIARLVESFRANHADYTNLEKDLKLVFPLFVEDFIHHIDEVEDTLFTDVRLLERAVREKCRPSRIDDPLERVCIHMVAVEDDAQDDEMEGIRRITRNYTVEPRAPLDIKVMLHELKEFEK